MKISVLTPTLRPDGLRMVHQCLRNQTHDDYEWIISAPTHVAENIKIQSNKIRVIIDRPKNEGDFYSLNKAFNDLTMEASTDNLVFAVDNIWFHNSTLERFAANFRDDPDGCVSSYGNHYRKIVVRDDKGGLYPEVLWNHDERLAVLAKAGMNSGKMPSNFMKLDLASMPRSRVIEAGMFDESYDKYAGCSEKELATRLQIIGCNFYLDQYIECRNWTHPIEHTSEQWDAKFKEGLQALRSDNALTMSGVRGDGEYASLDAMVYRDSPDRQFNRVFGLMSSAEESANAVSMLAVVIDRAIMNIATILDCNKVNIYERFVNSTRNTIKTRSKPVIQKDGQSVVLNGRFANIIHCIVNDLETSDANQFVTDARTFIRLLQNKERLLERMARESR